MKCVAAYEVGVVAADVDALVRFYVDTLGLRVDSDVSVPAEAGAATGLSPSGYRVVRLATSTGQRFKIARARPRRRARRHMLTRCGRWATFT